MARDWLEDGPGDWLDPEERYVGVIQAAENERRIAAEDAVNDIVENLPALVPAVKPDIELPADPKRQSEQLVACWARLLPIQQLFLSLLKQNHLNVRKTVRAIEASGRRFSRSTERQWRTEDDYGFVLKTITAVSVGDVIKKERLLLRADEIAEEALEPKPILHKGLPTGFYENQPDTALRANEQLMKATGLLRDAQQSTRVTVRLVNLAGPEHEVIESTAEVIDELTLGRLAR